MSPLIMKTCEMFAKRGFEVELWVPTRINSQLAEKDPFAYHGIERNFKIWRVPALDLLESIRGKVPFFILLATFNLTVALYALLRRFPKDTIFYLHDIRDAVLLTLLPQNKFLEIHDFYRSRVWFLNSFIFKRVSGFIVTNRLKIELLKKNFGIPEDRMLHQPNGVNVSLFNTKLSKNEAREELELPKDKKIILYTGHLFDWKGVDTLFDAYQYLGSEEIIYFVGGTDEDISRFQAKLRSANAQNVVIAGRRPHAEMPLWLKAADVLVLPNTGKMEVSRVETSPVKLFEYMASGTPIVASDLPSIRNIVDESIVQFFDPDDAVSLADSVRLVLRGEEQATLRARRALEEVKKYSWERRSELIIRFIRGKVNTYEKGA